MKPTQSNGTVFFRAVVMAGFLGVIFYAAVNGNALPDALRKQIEKYLPRVMASSKSTGADPAPFTSPASNASEAPPFNAAARIAPPLSINPAVPPMVENSVAPRQLPLDGHATPLVPPPLGGNPNAALGNDPSPVMPAGYLAQTQPPAMNAPNFATAPQNSGLSANAAASAPFIQIQDRLKQLGATYYLLETWGNQQQLYRFYCKTAVGGSTNYIRCFEYISADPLQAMNEVLKQVETWHNGGMAAQ